MPYTRKWEPAEIDMLICMFGQVPTQQIACEIDRSESAIYQMAARLGLTGSHRKCPYQRKSQYRYWQPYQIDYLLCFVGQMTYQEIGAEIGRTASAVEHMVKKIGMSSNLRSDHLPPRKYGREHHAFREPGIPYQAAGRMYIKPTDNSRPELYAPWLWCQHYGPIPQGHVIRHKDGNNSNCNIGNLECLSRDEHLALNSIQRYPPEVRSMLSTLGHYNRKVKQLSNQK